MQSLLARRSLALVPRGARRFGGHADSAEITKAVGADAVKKEIVSGLALGFVVSAVWWVWAKGQGRKMDKWNEKLRASKGQ